MARSIGIKTIGLVNELQTVDCFKDADLVISSFKDLNIEKILNL